MLLSFPNLEWEKKIEKKIHTHTHTHTHTCKSMSTSYGIKFSSLEIKNKKIEKKIVIRERSYESVLFLSLVEWMWNIISGFGLLPQRQKFVLGYEVFLGHTQRGVKSL